MTPIHYQVRILDKTEDTFMQFVDYITEIYWLANGSGMFAMRFLSAREGKKNWVWKSKNYLDRHSYGGVGRI